MTKWFLLSIFALGLAFNLSISAVNTALAQSAFGDPAEQVVSGGGGLSAVEQDVNGGAILLGQRLR